MLELGYFYWSIKAILQFKLLFHNFFSLYSCVCFFFFFLFQAESVIERETAIRVPITSLLSSMPKQSSETDVLCEDDMIITQQSVSFL